MTIHYRGVRPAYEVKGGNTNCKLVFPVKERTAHNNKRKIVKIVEVVDLDNVSILVTKGNMPTYHTFFTDPNYSTEL